ncbi:hypothetical protein KSX_88620 [Ktedonospora formicarum]|uniref:Uncharacterized protein n=1 Tax=Ktedonospora formicarum TaxID=2778364 RepID=A0A8J3I6Y8_9CHLR|nr:hypothetical protein KSX_88620 [Ktedonospora formicarum]
MYDFSSAFSRSFAYWARERDRGCALFCVLMIENFAKEVSDNVRRLSMRQAPKTVISIITICVLNRCVIDM